MKSEMSDDYSDEDRQAQVPLGLGLYDCSGVAQCAATDEVLGLSTGSTTSSASGSVTPHMDHAVPMMIDTTTGRGTNLRKDAKIITQGRLTRLKTLSEKPEEDLSCDQKSEKKRIIRLEKNRRAAAMSRRKKKLYIKNLEERAAMMAKHLAILEMENNQLRGILNQMNGQLAAYQQANTLNTGGIRQITPLGGAMVMPVASNTPSLGVDGVETGATVGETCAVGEFTLPFLGGSLMGGPTDVSMAATTSLTPSLPTDDPRTAALFGCHIPPAFAGASAGMLPLQKMSGSSSPTHVSHMSTETSPKPPAIVMKDANGMAAMHQSAAAHSSLFGAQSMFGTGMPSVMGMVNPMGMPSVGASAFGHMMPSPFSAQSHMSSASMTPTGFAGDSMSSSLPPAIGGPTPGGQMQAAYGDVFTANS